MTLSKSSKNDEKEITKKSKVSKTSKETKKKLPKDTNVDTEEESSVSKRKSITAFYASRISEAEKASGLVANTTKYLRPFSSGVLCVDWLFNGGCYNSMMVLQGMEQSAKTTLTNNFISSGLRNEFIFNAMIDAEGTMNEQYFGAMLAKFGMDLNSLEDPNTSYRYYRDSVIESVFNYMVPMLNGLPRKNWYTEAETWAYLFPKNDKFASELMDVYGVKADKSLTTSKFFVCPTEHDSIEAAFYIDSFAAMLTERDEEEEERSKIRAAEAQAFSNHLKRIAAKISNRGVALIGINQLRKVPGVVYGPSEYAPGGGALDFYSSQRAKLVSRSSGYHVGLTTYNKDMKALIEPSAFDDNKNDRYEYKCITNTKNKMGNPNKETWIRIWKADHQGVAHGIDPAFDLYWYLITTCQLVKTNRRKGEQLYKFNLRDSVGSKRAKLLNALPDFSEYSLKVLTLSEVFKSKDLVNKSMKLMGISKPVSLRDALFKQLISDKQILALNSDTKSKSKSDDDDDDGITDM
jgi:RecA/RadA recombinase